MICDEIVQASEMHEMLRCYASSPRASSLLPLQFGTDKLERYWDALNRKG